ncbi:MAG: hypothetical protein IPM64_13010 [Phycisphaerales bacterium]|nr:hypothetical protein [Phycisphaerales bacterium]
MAGATLIAAFAAALRFHRIGEGGLWRDEATAAFWSQLPAGELLRSLRDDVHAPLFYLVLGAWSKVAGTSEFALRALPALVGGLAAGAMAWALRPLAGSAALAAAAVLGLMPGFVLISQQVSPYSLLMLFAIGALGCQLRLLPIASPVADAHAGKSRQSAVVPDCDAGSRRSRARSAVLLSLCLSAMVYTHLWSVLLWTGLAMGVGVVGVFSLLRRRIIPGAFWWSLAAHAAAAVLWLPWMIPAIGQAGSRTMDHLPATPAALEMLRMTALFWFNHPMTSIGVLVLTAVAGAAAIARSRRDSLLGAAAIVLLCAVLLPHVACWLIPPPRVLYFERYALICAPAAIALIFVAFARLLPRNGALCASWALAVAIGAIPIVANRGFGMFFALSYRPSPMREVAKLLQREAEPQDVIVLYPELYAPALNWYFRGPQP